MQRVYFEDMPDLAIVATFTAEPLEPTLRFWIGKLGQSESIAFAPFNQVFQALLDPNSVLHAASWCRAILIRLEDWVAGDRTNLPARLTPLVEEFASAVKTIAARAPLLVIVCPGHVELGEIETQLLNRLKEIPGVHAFGSSAVTTLYPIDSIHDPQSDAIGQIPYTPAYFAALGTFIARMADAITRPPFKVIVLDCDNTLWSGVCGEGGVEAVTITPAHRALQQFVLEQMNAGKILCLCSKNAEQDVFDIFDHHPDMLIRREQIVAHRINWSPKSRNLQELAADLNLGLDSFILIEDNPIECAEVRANCPQVLVLQLPDEPRRFAPFLGNVWAFDQLRVTEQDRQRTQSYLDNVRREAVRKDAAGLEDFLSKLQLEVSISPIDAPRLPRAAQLTERTNQFNVSTIRRNEAQLQQLIQDGRHNCQIVGVKDRFGDYGLVGVMITRRDGSALVLDTFLLSCRVLGRGVEHQMLAHAGAKAMEFGLPCVEIPFAPTKKNQPAADFLDSIVSADNSSYRLPAAVAAQVKPAVVTAPQREIEDVSAVARKAPPYQQIAAEWNDPQPILAAVESRRRVAPPQSGYVAARTPREQALADIWQRVLSVDRVGIHDDYFALGGTSVMAVRLVLEIEKVFGRQLPIATLLKAPTIEKLSGLLDDPIQPDDLAVVTLRAEGDGPPLFLLPSIGGHVLSYRLLVQNLDTNHPVYGLEMRPEVPGNRVPRPMERIAAEFLQRILAIEPNGPYLLAGWSFGGSLAFELAHQLRARGKQVPLLVLIDTYCHGYPGRVPVSRRIRLHLQHFLKRSPAEHMRYLAMITSILAEKVWHRLLITLGLRKTKFYAFETPLTEEMVKVCDDSWNSYRPSRWPGHLVLLRAMRRKTRISQDFSDPYNGWGKFAESIEVHDVDANHLGLFEEPAVGRSAAALAHGIRSVLRN